jgi:hypothetical protein
MVAFILLSKLGPDISLLPATGSPHKKHMLLNEKTQVIPRVSLRMLLLLLFSSLLALLAL